MSDQAGGIERFNPYLSDEGGLSAQMGGFPDGQWVRYSDYEDLKEECHVFERSAERNRARADEAEATEQPGDPNCICQGTGLTTRLTETGNTGPEVCECVVATVARAERLRVRKTLELVRTALRASGTGEQIRIKALHAVTAAIASIKGEGR